ncbi:hypothetical protein AMAG_12444 [Allomyces macrogynus ATCC 38327]|uniref:Peptidase M12B domain-containing protein n=1 Tax=Allomyces macrogynus (strain ATCC 38327) TaxID=578462 RepID=A0A0L0SYY0_ALLM3|nr:hypothetical protein AMAG_12444 [Allomyces macrogynus ATCC 38327]|eukprot:KNE67712.1 hypothetical protein AMAG_12444 [Allomyces macrogynus ATCC 38327]
MHGVIHFNETHRYAIRPDAAALLSTRQARDPDSALARPHQLIRDSGAGRDGSGAAATNHHFCNHKTIDDVDQQLDEETRVEAEHMRRDASALRSAAIMGGAPTVKKRGLETNKGVEMMVVSDYERYQVWGNQTELSILVFVNNVDSLLRSNKILPDPYTLRATLVGTYTATSPMWAPSNATVNEIHVQFCQWRRDWMTDPAFAGTFIATTAHTQLLTGRSLGGVLWVSGMCYSLYSCSVAPGVKIPVMAGLGMGMTHELAHNLGAYHDNIGMSTCNSTDYIKSPYYCGSCQQQPAAFSNCSINEMRTQRSSRPRRGVRLGRPVPRQRVLHHVMHMACRCRVRQHERRVLPRVPTHARYDRVPHKR